MVYEDRQNGAWSLQAWCSDSASLKIGTASLGANLSPPKSVLGGHTMVNHKEILRFKSFGLTNREVAEGVGCSRNTVTRM